MRDIIKDSALVLAEKIRCGEIKIVEVLDAVYESEKQNKELNCFITLCRERAYSKGSEIQKRIDAIKGTHIILSGKIASSNILSAKEWPSFWSNTLFSRNCFLNKEHTISHDVVF